MKYKLEWLYLQTFEASIVRNKRKQTDKAILTVEYLNIFFCHKLMRTPDKIIGKDIKDLNNTIKQSNLINMHRRLYPSAPEYRFSPSACGAPTKREHMLGPQ